MTGKSIAFLSDADWPNDYFDKSLPIDLLFAMEKAAAFGGLEGTVVLIRGQRPVRLSVLSRGGIPG